MTTNESEAWDGLPSAEELCRLTSRNARGDFANSPSHEAFIALGESADAAAKDFDWQRMARAPCARTRSGDARPPSRHRGNAAAASESIEA